MSEFLKSGQMNTRISTVGSKEGTISSPSEAQEGDVQTATIAKLTSYKITTAVLYACIHPKH
jgi:hypothetical protein